MDSLDEGNWCREKFKGREKRRICKNHGEQKTNIKNLEKKSKNIVEEVGKFWS